MTLVFREVRRAWSVKRPSTATPSRTISWVSRWPGLSSPTRPRTSTWAPRATRLLTTLPAPPRVRVSRSTSTTATGASGEMRSTFPQRYSSSIKSPATRTLRLENPSRSRLRRRSPCISALSGDSGDMASGSLLHPCLWLGSASPWPPPLPAYGRQRPDGGPGRPAPPVDYS